MKKLYKVQICTDFGIPIALKEIIADNSHEAMNYIAKGYNYPVILKTRQIAYEDMTAEQKMKVIDADWNSYESKLRKGIKQ